MNKSTLIALIAGAAIGSVGTWFVVKKKYERIAQEEIDSVKELYSQKPKYEGPQDSEEAKEKAEMAREKPSVAEYARKISEKQGYTSYDGYSKKEEESTVVPKPITPGERPYVIPPEEFGEFDDYSKISLIFYADQVLCDDADIPVDNVDEIVGFDSLNHFGEYEDDSVFVRNDARKCDYEILKSLRTYAEVLEEKPYKAEV